MMNFNPFELPGLARMCFGMWLYLMRPCMLRVVDTPNSLVSATDWSCMLLSSDVYNTTIEMFVILWHETNVPHNHTYKQLVIDGVVKQKAV